ncbi:MAG: universal stress protein [Deltaproteobacteria bacterium]|jgi:nucleotide-binding universal stress UspA family protein
MNKGIVILLTGSHADLFASLRAMGLAKRTGGEVHVLLGPPAAAKEMDGEIRDLFRAGEETRHFQKTVAWLAETEGVEIRCHLLEDEDWEDKLLAFLKDHLAFCLVIGASGQSALKRLSRWAAELRRKLLADRHWYADSFWTLVTDSWDDEKFEQALRHINFRGS